MWFNIGWFHLDKSLTQEERVIKMLEYKDRKPYEFTNV